MQGVADAAGAAAAGDAWDAARTRLRLAGPPLAYGVRLAASVCLALYVAFWLELDQASWAGTSAAITCQPVLGAAMRKGQFRFIGTAIGAVFLVVLTAFLPQSRPGFLAGMVLWTGLCSYISTLLKGPPAYAAMLAGYTTAIIAGSSITAPDDAFRLALDRASEIMVGIACATVVLAGTDRGHISALLAARIRGVAAGLRDGLRGSFAAAGDPDHDSRPARRGLIRAAAALDPDIDNAIGERAALRHRRPTLRDAAAGLFGAASGWRTVATHLRRLAPEAARAEAARVLAVWPAPAGRPDEDRDRLLDAARRLLAMPAATSTERLLADQTAGALRGLARAANGVALLSDFSTARRPRRLRLLRAPDRLPALVNAIRVMAAVGFACLFWIVTAWPNGLTFVMFTSIPALLMSPLNEMALPSAMRFVAGSLIALVACAIIDFAVLPGMVGFGELALVISVALIPLGALQATARFGLPFTAAVANFVPLLGPANQITYDQQTFYNTASAIIGGLVVATAALWLIPPVPARVRARRLARASLRDVRRIAAGRWRPAQSAWQSLMYDRLGALTPRAELVDGARMVTALLVGGQLLRLRTIAARHGVEHVLDAAARPLAEGDIEAASRGFAALDAALAARPAEAPGAFSRLRARAATAEITEALAAHGPYFEGRG